MPTSSDGILTCTFDPERVAVQIEVDGSAWPAGSDVSRVTITRASTGQGTIPVRDLERRAVAGGTLLWVDNEAPLGVDVTYACIGYDSFGDEVPVGPVNLFTNPSFETNAAWLTSGAVASVAQSTFMPLAGEFAALITINSSPVSTTSGVGLDTAAVAPGEWVAARIPIRPDGAIPAPAARLRITFLDAADATISTVTSARTAVTEFSYNFLTIAGQAPANTASARVFLFLSNAGSDVPLADSTARTDAWISSVADTQAEALADVATYFDGNTPGAEWTGAPDASTSFLPIPTEVTVSTTGAAEGLWVKIPGRADMVTRVGVQDVGEMSRATLGGSWQVPGGVAIAQSAAASLAQSAGLGSLSTTLRVLSRDAGQTAALWQILGQAPGQVVMLQTAPQPEELPSGYYQVVNPSQGTLSVRPDLYGKRPFSLPITEAVMPAGSGTGLFGATHDDVTQSFSSHTEIAATVSSHLELAEGAWS